MGGRGARGRVVAELSRREFIGRASAVGVGMLVAGALPVARAHALLGVPAPIDPDPTLQAFADTVIPGRKAIRTDLGDPIDHQAAPQVRCSGTTRINIRIRTVGAATIHSSSVR